jgi:quercetin dioxygenase-like cupin family protein
MRHLALALLVLGCSSGKQAAPSTTPDPGTGTSTGTSTGDPGAGMAGETGATGAMAAKKKEMPPPPPDTGGFKLVAPSSLKYTPADPSNPAGPELAVVTGDLQKGGGFFLKLPAGYKPPLHTHTSDYHAIVVSGAPRHWVAGGEKNAKPLGAGSYWFQPGNQPHGDECTGKEPCLLYIVIAGAFDFTPTPKAKPVKPEKYFLAARKDLKFNPLDPKQPDGAKLALVSGDLKTGPVAFIVEMPPGANAGLHSHTSEYHAIVLEGAPAHWLPHEPGEGEPLASGAYWFQPGGYDHGDRCTGTAPCRTFVMMPKAFDAKPPAKK